MRRILIVIILLTCTISVMAQKVWVGITKSGDAAEAGWQVMDEQFNPVFSSTEYPVDDSIPFSLEANKRYLFEVSITRIYNPDTILCRLYVNSEPLLLVKTDAGPGDHFYYFFTGVREEPSKITGGTYTDITAFPWQVYLIAGNYTCGGSMISDRWVVTAAHCTVDDFGHTIPASSMRVLYLSNNPYAGQGTPFAVSQVIPNEGFDSNTLENDIALLKLSTPVSSIFSNFIRLVSANDAAAGATDPGVLGWVTGYGLTSVNPPTYPNSLQKVQLPIVSNAQASSVWTDIPVTDMMAGYLNGGKDACSGDSGGPFSVMVNNTWKLAGIVSWGSSQCDTYGAYTRVSLFEKWIISKTGNLNSNPAAIPDGDSIICYGSTSSAYTVNGNMLAATNYEWQLLPSEAGTLTYDLDHATVNWNPSFLGTAMVMFRYTTGNSVVSDWSTTFVHVVRNTSILSQSRDTALCAGQSVGLDVNTEGYNITYDWFRNDTLLQSGANNHFYIGSSASTNSGIYTVKLTSLCGSLTSAPVELTIYPLTGITFISPDQEVVFSGSVNLEVTAKGHDLTYQWQKDSVLLAGSIGSELALQNIKANATGLYRVTVKGTCGTVESNKIYVYVRKNDNSADPQVFVWPTHTSTSISVALSTTVNYNVRVFGATGALIFEKNGCQYLTDIDISSLARGLYIITVYNNSFRKSFKVVRE